jgi:broad specificity phosphatase PhoE
MKDKTSCEIYVIRHGETDWNVEKRLQGHTDIPLNAEGEKQALQIKEKLEKIEFTAVFSSDLSRASQTAGIIMGEKREQVIKTTALRERYMGAWEGRYAHEFHAELQEQKQSNVESLLEVYNRLYSFIKMQAPFYLGFSILLVSHGGVLRALLSQFDCNFDTNSEVKWQISNCAHIRLKANHNGEITLVDYEGIQCGHEHKTS